MNRWNLGLQWSICQAPEGCIKRDNLMRCSACHVVPYCSVEHQKAHRPAHKLHCGLIKKDLVKLAKEEAALRAHTTDDDPELPANPFESAVGHFWTCRPTRPYMNRRYDLVLKLLNIRTGEAVEAALDHLLDMLRLCRADNGGHRSQVPALYLRLGRDQEAYDFIKWWADVSDDYDWGNMELPYLNVKGADPFKPINLDSGIKYDLSMKVALLLLKSRLFVDVSMLEGFLQKLGDKAPSDRMEIVKEECMSDIMLNRRDIVDATDYTPIMADLRREMVAIYHNIRQHNKYIIPALEDPSRYSQSPLQPYTIGSENEAIMTYRHSWYSFAECPSVTQRIMPLLKES